MTIKKKMITGIFTVLLLVFGGMAAVYAAEDTTDADMQAQESTATASQTILVGAATAEKKAAEAAEAVETAEASGQENDISKEPAENTAANSRLVSLGVFKTTGYCPCNRCSGGWGRRTSTGAIASSNHTVAVDSRVIPYGSKIMVNGVIYTAEDCGGAVRGNHIDIFYDTHSQALQHGSRRAEVFLVK